MIGESYPANVLFGKSRTKYLIFIFCPAIISCVQFEIMMTYSIFATKEDIQAAVFCKRLCEFTKTLPKKMT